MVDIASFTDVAAPRARHRRFSASGKLLPQVVFGVCFAFTMALVLGVI